MSKLRPDPAQTLTDVPRTETELWELQAEDGRRIRAALDYVEHISTEELEMLVRIRRAHQHGNQDK